MATSLKLDDAMKSRLQNLATSRNRSAHWVMREAIRQYVEREEARESFKAEANASWAAYQETGRHLTGMKPPNGSIAGARPSKSGRLRATTDHHRRGGARSRTLPLFSGRQKPAGGGASGSRHRRRLASATNHPGRGSSIR